MPKTVTIPGYDKPIDFPDSMSQDQINAASKKLYEAKHPPTSAPPAKPGIFEWWDKFTAPVTEIQKPDSSKKWNPSEALKAVGNIGAGGLGMLLHPLDTLAGIGGMITAPFEMATGTPFKKTVPGELLQSLKENPYGTVEAGIGQAGAAAGIGAGIGEVADAVPAPKGTSTTIPRVLRPLVEKTREAQKAATESADEYANAIKQKTGEIAADQSEKSKAAKAKGIEQERTHQKSVEETKAANKAAIREQEKIAPTKEKLQKSVQEMQAQVETAREKALKIGNQKYSTVNSALNPIQADPEVMRGAIADATEALKGSHADPTLLKQVVDKLQRGDAFTYEDLQGDYSRLGTAISKGTIPGDEFHSFDVLHEAIGDEMQRIADANGQGPQLKAARVYWRRMKQAFGKPYNPTDVANVVLDKTAGSVMRQAEQSNRLRLLGSFDKTIPQTAEHIENLQKGIDALPKEQPLRSILKPLPEKPAPVPPPKFEGTPEELAKQQTNLQKPVGKTVIDKADIEEAKRGRLQKDTDLVRTKGAFGATVLSLYALRSLLHGELGPLGSVPFDVGGALAVTHGVARMMERPSVVKFFTKATAKDIASIPPELRGDLPQLVSAARKSGVKVSPAIAAAAGAASAPKKTPGDILRQAQ